MKQNRTFLNWLLLLMMTVGMTSCQGLADAVFGTEDHPAQSGSTIPDIQIDNATLTLSVGQTASRPATAKSADIQLTYASSTPAVATVSQAGKVTAFSAGETTVTVSAPQISKSVSFKVVVNAIPAEQLAAVEKATPLTFLPQDDGKITVTFYNGITLAGDIHYTINDGQEQTIAKNTAGAYDIQAKKGDVVQLYSINTSLGGGAVAGTRGGTRAIDEGAKYINIRPSMKTEIYGNVMSLLKGKDGLEGATAIEAKNAFYGLFAGAENLVNNADRLLVLPATTLKEGCYQDMFNGCKGIEKAPELPAPKLEKNCYQEMFYDCAKLNSVRCLATDITAENSTKDWLGNAGTEATGEKVLETAVPMASGSDDGVPSGWTEQKAETDVPATAVTSVTLDKTTLALTVGDAAVQLTATVAPEAATDKTVTWSSDKTSVATVDATGKVTAVAAGEATITATAGDKTATCTVTVTAAAVAVTSVGLDKTTLALTVGDAAVQLTATVAPEDATDKTVTWSSDKTSVATVDATGKVTAVAEGTATITATAGDKTATCTVTVKAATIAVTSVALDKTELALTVGDAAVQLTATVDPDNATDKTVTWSSDKTSVATVDATGKVTAVAAGTATITATAGDKTATCTVTVTAATIAVTSVALDKTELVLIVGDAAVQLKATVLPEDATDKSVTWSIDKPAVATVDATGKVTAVAEGEATITAKAGDKTATCKVIVKVAAIEKASGYVAGGDPTK